MYKSATDVIATDLEHELILLDPRNGEMFALNETGRCVWLALPARTVDDLASALNTEFEVTPIQAREDVQAFLVEMTDRGLVELIDG